MNNANVIPIDSGYLEMFNTYYTENKDYYKKSLELEILGSLIEKPGLYDYIFSKIKIEQISDDNKKAFQLVKEFDFNKESDLFQLKLQLAKIGFYEDAYRINFTPNEFMVKRKIQCFLQIYFAIEVIKFFSTQLKELENSIDGLTPLFDLRNKVDALMGEIPDFETEKTLHETLPEFFDMLESTARKNDLLKSGKFPTLNEITKGIDKENVVTILGNSGHGKTFFATELLIDLAFNHKIPVGIISLEMSQLEIMSRIVGSGTGLSSELMRNPDSLKKLTKVQISELINAYRVFKDTKIYISDRPMNELQLREKIKNWKNQFGVKAVMIDYIGLIGCTQKYKSREEVVSYLSGYIKNISKEFHVPIILLGQTNRAGAKDPNSTNVAESYKIIANSDFVFTIYQPIKIDSYYKNMQINNRAIPITNDLFIIQTDKARFSGSYEKFAVRLWNGGMREVETEDRKIGSWEEDGEVE